MFLNFSLQHLRSFTSSPNILSKKNNGDEKKEKSSQEEASNKLNDLLNKMIQVVKPLLDIYT